MMLKFDAVSFNIFSWTKKKLWDIRKVSWLIFPNYQLPLETSPASLEILDVQWKLSNDSRFILFLSLKTRLSERDPVWRKAGTNLIESVSILLERLLDYREVAKVSKFQTIVRQVNLILSLRVSTKLLPPSFFWVLTKCLK